MSAYKIGIFFVMIFAIGSTIFNIVGPKILGKATTEYLKVWSEKYPVEAELILKDRKISYMDSVVPVYVTSAVFSFIQGYIMTGVSQKLTIA